MKKVIIDTDMVVDGMSQTFAQNLGGAMGGVASGFELAQGAMGAFGASGEAVEEALLKVQSAMAISQGIQGIKESIASFKALRTAVMSNVVVQKALNLVMSMNPIGLIIAGVVALGAAVAALWSPIKKLGQFFGLVEEDAASLEDQQKQLNAQMEAYNSAMERSNQIMEKNHANRMRQLKLEGATAEEIHKESLKQLKEDEDARIKDLATRKWQLSQQQKLYDKAIEEGEDDRAREIKKEIKANKQKIHELKLLNGDYDLSRREQEQEYSDFLADEEQKRIDEEKAKQSEALANYKEHLQNRKDARREIEDLELQLIRDANDRKLAEQKTQYERDLQDLKSNTKKNAQEKAELEALLTEKYSRERAELEMEIRLETQEALLPVRELELENHNNLEIQKTQYTLENFEKRKEAERLSLEQARAVEEGKLEAATAALTGINDLVQAFAGENEKSQRRAFNINKAVNIAMATMETYKGATAIFASAAANPKSVLFPAQPFIMAGAAIASGLANVATIARQKFQASGSVGGGSAASPNVPSVGGASPNFNIVGDTGVNQLAETLGNSNQQPVKAYVVGNDVTTQQSLDRNIVETASI
jgi:DNA repair exonuclease SbcCD ATPase subunit